MKLNQRQVQHLYLRAGFGISYSMAKKLVGSSAKKLFANILSDAQKIKQAQVISKTEVLNTLMALKDATPDEKKAVRKMGRNKLKDLNTWWLSQMATSPSFLREKMTFFWHGHFACNLRRPFLMQQQHNTLKENALSNFGELLHAISKDPAMLQFLNNQQNKKHSPNENFAREVMELFTLGRGNYTESDIKEAARAFTGWGSNKEGQFNFRKRQHDYGQKTIFGKTKDYDGEEVLDLLLEKPQTARFITEKLFRFFVSEHIDEQLVASLSQNFYTSGYDISELLTEIFTSDWFYEERFIGNKIKSPIELIAGIGKQFSVSFDSNEPLLYMQKVLGQMLLSPPNVAGWPEGKAWIDSSTLMVRLRLTELIFVGAELRVKAKESGDVGDVYKGKGEFKKITPKIPWEQVGRQFKSKYLDANFEAMKYWLLQADSVPVQASNKLNQLEQLKENALKITQLPEYQLC